MHAHAVCMLASCVVFVFVFVCLFVCSLSGQYLSLDTDHNGMLNKEELFKVRKLHFVIHHHWCHSSYINANLFLGAFTF